MSVRFEDHTRTYLAYSRRVHTPATHRTLRALVEGKLVPWFEGRLLPAIEAADIERLLAAHPELSPASRNRIVGALSALLQYARRLGYVERNVAATVPREREEVSALPLVGLEDQRRLLEEVPAEPRLLFLAALDTGARLGELLRLTWADVDWEQGGLLIRRSKSRRPRMVRMSRRLAGALRAHADGRGLGATRRIFAAGVGADGALRWAWRKRFKRAAAAIGQPDLRIHDLRHLAAINLVRAGVDLPTVQAHLGHLHLVSTLRYAAYADETASGRAARVLDRLHGDDEG